MRATRGRSRVSLMNQLTRVVRLCCEDFLKKWSGRLDSNQRPPAPKAGALPGCATPRHLFGKYWKLLQRKEFSTREEANAFSLCWSPAVLKSSKHPLLSHGCR